MTNRQKLLHMVKELHKRGFGYLRVNPSVSPSGMYWRCTFINQANMQTYPGDNWINIQESQSPNREIEHTPEELADLFIREVFEFVSACKGLNEEYVNWFEDMLGQLKKGELPYAYADWNTPEGVWVTSIEKTEIKTLPDEVKYCRF